MKNGFEVPIFSIGVRRIIIWNIVLVKLKYNFLEYELCFERSKEECNLKDRTYETKY